MMQPPTPTRLGGLSTTSHNLRFVAVPHDYCPVLALTFFEMCDTPKYMHKKCNHNFPHLGYEEKVVVEKETEVEVGNIR